MNPFYFTLPGAPGPETGRESGKILVNANVNEPSRCLKVLIAEDDEASRMYLSLTLQKAGNEVFQASSGTEAVELCRSKPGMDLVLMDIKLPLMDGIEATRQIRLFNKEVVVIAQTAYTDLIISERQKLIDAGCNECISKPIHSEKLRQLIRQYFNKT